MKMHRRTLLRGVGKVAVGLPLLEAMLDSKGHVAGSAFAAAAPPPVRLIMLHFPYGAEMSTWTPTTVGATYVMPASLAPLEKHRAQTLVLSGLANMGAQIGEGDSHEKGRLCFATGMPPASGGKLAGGPSLDQVAAKRFGKQTKIPALALSAADLQGGTTQYLSWVDKGQYFPYDTQPQQVFDKLFMNTPTGSDPEAKARAEVIRKKRQSVLDFVKADATRLDKQLGANDKLRVQAHLTAVRELERRLEVDASQTVPACTPPTRPEAGDIPWQWTYSYGGPPLDRLDLLFDLMAAAFQCDATRYIMYPLWTNIGDWIKEQFTDDRGHHQISHDDSTKKIQTAYCAKQMELIVRLMDRLKARPDGTGNVLDNTLIYVSSEISHGNAHNYNNLPVLLLGGAGGKIKTGRHVNYAPTLEPGKFTAPIESWVDVNRLFLSMLNVLGVTDVRTWGAPGKEAKMPLDLT
ncbi:MAG: DUF1552 domain-containing protein [Deltaproteobacteria bacterium]|nr:DUF1552 domain-containing protein [Deltaproteobacteria bacterium]